MSRPKENVGQTQFTWLHGESSKRQFRSWEVTVTKTGATRTSDAIELLPTKYIMPKTSFNSRISATFEEIAEALNNPKLQEEFLNFNKENEILKEIVETFNKRTTVHRPRVGGMNTPSNIAHVRPRVEKPLHAGKVNVQKKTVNPIPLQDKRIPEKQNLLEYKQQH